MTEDFERNQHREYYTNWSKNYYQQADSFERTAPDINEVSDLHYYYETTLTRAKVEPLLITDQTLSFMLEIALEQKYAIITPSTFYVKDIRDLKDTPFNTLIFRFDGPPLKTIEDSRAIMERYFKQKPFHYNFIQYAGKSLGFHKRCPFVAGPEIFIPEKGTTVGSTSWYAAHHILLATENKKGNYMHLTFRHYYELQLDVSPHSFKEQIERSAVLSHIQHSVISELIGLYPNASLPPFRGELNIVEKRLTNPTFKPVRFPTEKIMWFMCCFGIHQGMEYTFGEKNPYIEEVQQHFLHIFKMDASSIY